MRLSIFDVYTFSMTTQPLLADAIPELAIELEALLSKQGEPALASQVPELRIVDRCRCGDDFCATFYTQSKPKGSYGKDHKCVEVTPEKGMIILDVISAQVMKVGAVLIVRCRFPQAAGAGVSDE